MIDFIYFIFFKLINESTNLQYSINKVSTSKEDELKLFVRDGKLEFYNEIISVFDERKKEELDILIKKIYLESFTLLIQKKNVKDTVKNKIFRRKCIKSIIIKYLLNKSK